MIIKSYLGGRAGLGRGDVHLVGGAIKCLLVKQGSTFMSDKIVPFLSDFTDLKEVASSGYVRKTLASPLLTYDWDRDKVTFSATKPTWTALVNDDLPIIGMIVFQHVGADSANIPLYGYQLNVAFDPGGANYTFPFSTDGIVQL